MNVRDGIVQYRQSLTITVPHMPWQNFLSPGLGQSSRGKYPYCCRYLIFLITQCRIGPKKTSMPKTSWIRPAISIELRLVKARHRLGAIWAATRNEPVIIIIIASIRASTASRE